MISDQRSHNIQYRPDGSVVVHLKSGDHCLENTGSNIPVTVSAAHIESVGIKNLIDVDSHTVHTILNSRSHVVRFNNGGLLKFSYNKEGQLIELSSSNLRCEVSKSSEVIFSAPVSE